MGLAYLPIRLIPSPLKPSQCIYYKLYILIYMFHAWSVWVGRVGCVSHYQSVKYYHSFGEGSTVKHHPLLLATVTGNGINTHYITIIISSTSFELLL